MTDTNTPEPRTWDVENPDITADEYLVGCCQRRWVGDEESKASATGIVLASVFHAAGLSEEAAVDAAISHMEREISITLTEEGLRFSFGEDEEPGDYDEARRTYDAAIERGLSHAEAADEAWPLGAEGP